jgi:hypothetical protein
MRIGDWVEVIADVQDMSMQPCKGKFGILADLPINGIHPIRLEDSSAYLSADEFRLANDICAGRPCIVCNGSGVVPRGYMRGRPCICQIGDKKQVEA